MKAAVLHANEDLRYEETETPAPKKGEVLVRVRACGICGSDVPRVLYNGAHFYPIVLGHEFSGEIAGIGEGVTGFEIGDRVAGIPLIPCKNCPDCDNGNYSLCKNYTFIGSRCQGAFAEYVAIPAENAIKFDPSVSFSDAAFFEPSTVALHGVFCSGMKKGDHVAVLGCGTIGLFTLQWAKIMGAATVTVFDINPARLALAKKLGADHLVHSGEQDAVEEAKKRFPRGFETVFESAGNVVTEKLSFELVGNRGRVCLIGTPNKEISFSPREFENLNRKEFVLTGSWMSYSAPFPGREWEMTAEHLKRGDLVIGEEFIFRKYPLSDALSAFLNFKTPGAVNGKIQLIP